MHHSLLLHVILDHRLLNPMNQNKTRWWFQICVIFTPIPREMIQFDGLGHIFQMGGEFNHQLVHDIVACFTSPPPRFLVFSHCDQ